MYVQSRLNNVFKYYAFNVGIKNCFVCLWHQSTIFILFFITHKYRPCFRGWWWEWCYVQLLWQRFICAFLMLWKVQRECCNSRNCNLGWVDDCVPQITMVRLTDSSNSRYYVRHYGNVDTVVMFMAWESPSPYSLRQCNVMSNQSFKKVIMLRHELAI